MRTIARMVIKDLRRRIRAPLGVLVVLSFSILFSLLIGLTFGGGGSQMPKVHLLVENLDDGPVGNMLLSALDSNEAAEYFDIEIVGTEGASLIEDDKGSALLRIPENFSIDLLEGTPASLELLRNPSQSILPEIAEQTAGVLVEILDTGSHALRGPMEQVASFIDSETVRITDESVAALAVVVYRIIDGGGNYLSPPAITLDAVDLEAEDEEGDDGDSGGPGTAFIFLMVLPGVSVYALFLIGDIGMRDILTEGTAGTLRRQISGPVSAGTLIIAKALYTAVLAAICLVIISFTGWLAVEQSVSIPGFLVLSFALVLAVTGAGATVYGISGNERRGATIASIVYLVLAFAGGSFVQLEGMPDSVQAIAPISPFYWGTMGYRALLATDAGLTDIAFHAAILAGIGIVFLALGSMLLGRRVRKGGAS